ncbi:glutamine synthetase [Lebetimonas natsushimae]|uniref:Glutamine synthetase n=1 Tax=Lebetimonas natsushimae TaxID=1936991 RepID=A0A292YDD1_9BACT|nr:type I glutamate--ammonia ligase [Lebetimonas natsushimae]GAX87234.1 glutamine synthetase [Lebetimonas natsushimae]
MKIAEFLKECRESEIEFIDFRFTDIKGTWHHVTYDIDSIDEDTFKNGLPFDGSSIPAWQPINESDMILMPDLEVGTHFIDPFTADPTMVVFCDVLNTDYTPYEKCPRSIAKQAQKHLEESGIADTAFFGAENEFFVFENVKIRDQINSQCYWVDTPEGEWNADNIEDYEYNTGHRPGTKGGYFPVPPVDSMMDLRAEMVKVLKEVGLETFVVHHEVAQGQGEIGVKFGTLVEAADNVQKLKYVVKMVAHLNGKTATFMPKPLYGDNGNGMHTHQSLWKDGKNLFYKKGEYGNLSDIARWYIGGIFHHAHAVAALTNASTNSYKRLIPGFEAPSILTFSSRNRSASCRIPFGSGEKSTRIEMRFPDSSANPYLAFAAMLMAGLDGIKNKYEPVGPMDIDLFELTLDEIREKGIKQLPHTLREALEALIADHEFLKPVFTEDFIQTYQHYKFETQVWPDEARPTAYEFKSTYSC